MIRVSLVAYEYPILLLFVIRMNHFEYSSIRHTLLKVCFREKRIERFFFNYKYFDNHVINSNPTFKCFEFSFKFIF